MPNLIKSCDSSFFDLENCKKLNLIFEKLHLKEPEKICLVLIAWLIVT
nr:MAG TPA: hypothetical protein [Caudoviricetes sp.]